MNKSDYIQMIGAALDACEDIELLDLIWKILCKSERGTNE